MARTAGLYTALHVLGTFVALLACPQARAEGVPALEQAQAVAPAPLPGFLRHQLLYGPPVRPTLRQPAMAPSTGLLRLDSLGQRPVDPWLAFDKVQHVTFSFLWTLGSQYTLVNKASWSEARALPFSVGLSALVGLAKEYYDWRHRPGRYFSRRDLVADAVGILLATGVVLL